MSDDIRKQLEAVLERYQYTPEAPDAFARRLLVEPLIEPKSSEPATLEHIKRYLKSQHRRVYGLAEKTPADGWVAEVQRAPVPVILLTRDAVVEALKPHMEPPKNLFPGDKWTPNIYDIEREVERAVSDLEPFVRPFTSPASMLRVFIAVDAVAVAGSFKRI